MSREIVDTNSSYLAQRLWDLDITTRWMTSCCDDENDITTAVDQALNRADLVVCSGGLGPTEDDLTVDVVAKLADADVVIRRDRAAISLNRINAISLFCKIAIMRYRTFVRSQ